MKKAAIVIGSLISLLGLKFLILGALYKIQSWENPAWLKWDLLTVGVLISLLGAATIIVASLSARSKPDVETKLVLKDLPETVPEAKDQLRRDEDMIV